MTVLSEIRPKLGNDSFFLPDKNGFVFRNDGLSVFVPGETLYPLIVEVVHHLTGELSVQEICALFPSDSRESIVGIIEHLLRNGVLKASKTEDSVQLPSSVCACFRPQIDFIEHLADNPLKRFENFRQSRTLLVGSGLPLSTCAAALIRYGLEELSLLPTEPLLETPVEVGRAIAVLHSRGIRASSSIVERLNASLDLRPYSLIGYVSDSSSLRDVLLLNRRCSQERRLLLVAIIVDNQSFMGPLIKQPGCWVCGLLRLSRCLVNHRRYKALRKRVSQGDGLLGKREERHRPLAINVGSDLAFEIFKVLAGNLRPEIERGMLVQTLKGQDALAARFIPHSLYACVNLCKDIALPNSSPHQS